jgi:hypothetical protein
VDACSTTLDPAVNQAATLCNAPHETHRYGVGIKRDPSSRGGVLDL